MKARELIENEDAADLKREAMSSGTDQEITRLGFDQESPGYYSKFYDMSSYRKNADDDYKVESLLVQVTVFSDYDTVIGVFIQGQGVTKVLADIGTDLEAVDKLIQQFEEGRKPVRWLSRGLRRLGFS